MYDKVILLIEGIDQFVDQETGLEAGVAFWLPKYFPERVRVICTADKDSEAFKYFKDKGSEILHIPVDNTMTGNLVLNHEVRELFITSELRNKHLEILRRIPEKRKNNLFI